MSEAAVKTGIGPTVSVAIEQLFPEEQRILQDDLAYAILPFGMRMLVGVMRISSIRDWMVREAEKSAPGIWGGLMCRKRYIDEKLLQSASHMDAIVNLGAGFDTRIYRLPALAKIPVWEVDHMENIKPKKARLEKHFGEIPAHIKLVTIDFDREELGPVLTANGYSPDQKTFFIWEAVTQYLTPQSIENTFAYLAQAAPGSRLTFTYILKDFLDGTEMYNQQTVYKQYVDKNQTWRFGLHPQDIPAFLNQYGWQLIEDIGNDDMAEKYVKPTHRQLGIMAIERMVYAEKVG